jgi:sortase A
MAFGPTYLESSALPGTVGNTVVVGHRDSHFEILQELAPGDEIWVETPDGVRHRYLVAEAEVLDEGDAWVTAPLDEKTLTLITCYPFDAVVPGGPGRYVVWALGDEQSS